jgi:hypothetical protein
MKNPFKYITTKSDWVQNLLEGGAWIICGGLKLRLATLKMSKNLENLINLIN